MRKKFRLTFCLVVSILSRIIILLHSHFSKRPRLCLWQNVGFSADIAVLVIYFLIILGAGLFVGFR